MKTSLKKLLFITGISLTFHIVPTMAQELSRTQATHLLADTWMRDPYIIIGPDQHYYLTYTNGKMEMPVWRSTNLQDWEKLGENYNMKKLSYYQNILNSQKELIKERGEAKLWAPEIYYINHQWVAVHTSNLKQSSIITSSSPEFENISEPMEQEFGLKHAKII